MKNLKKTLLSSGLALSMVLGLAFSFTPEIAHAQASLSSPCETGVSSVSSSWWPPSNDTTYTMCGCQAVSGTSSSGSC